jgi:preprotein translocase subunit YajC
MALVVMNNHRMNNKEMKMTESVKNLINAISAGDAVETENAFQVAIADKISARLADMKIEVAKGMFAQQEVEAEQEVEQETQTTEE